MQDRKPPQAVFFPGQARMLVFFRRSISFAERCLFSFSLLVVRNEGRSKGSLADKTALEIRGPQPMDAAKAGEQPVAFASNFELGVGGKKEDGAFPSRQYIFDDHGSHQPNRFSFVRALNSDPPRALIGRAIKPGHERYFLRQILHNGLEGIRSMPDSGSTISSQAVASR